MTDSSSVELLRDGQGNVAKQPDDPTKVMLVQPPLVTTMRLMGVFSSWIDSTKRREAGEQKRACTEDVRVEARPKANAVEINMGMRVLKLGDLFLLRENSHNTYHKLLLLDELFPGQRDNFY